MVAWLRVLAKPAVLKRFVRSRAGKRAALKYGKMLLESKMVRDLIGKFMNRNGKNMDNNKEYKKQVREYQKLEKRVADLELKLENAHNDREKTETLTFTLGRTVVQMQQLLAQMQELYQQQFQQMQIAMANVKTR
ncbi:MAG: hypothetical protein IKW57_03500 [Alphaproteobacteria bacterium]|nr:hypothetical protein [Alphaproteobacteria bacterium]